MVEVKIKTSILWASTHFGPLALLPNSKVNWLRKIA